MNQNNPKVTLLIVVRNEIKYIDLALNSLLAQDIPEEYKEYIIVDSMSTDGTREWLDTRVSQLFKLGFDIKLIENPGKILSSGWNTGIKAAKGEFICRIDAHSEISSDYIMLGMNELLQNKKIVSVGGVLHNQSSSFIGNIIADFFSSSFGIGNAYFRIAKNKIKKNTDTVSYGIYQKNVFGIIGFFNESLVRNQDLDLHKRIINAGFKLLTYPQMKITYYVRDSFVDFIKKAFSDGFWIAISGTYYIRHLIPFLFVLYLFLVLFISIFSELSTYLVLSLVYVYVILSFFFGLKDGKTLSSKMLLPVFYLSYHITYGIGSFIGYINKTFNVKNIVR